MDKAGSKEESDLVLQMHWEVASKWAYCVNVSTQQYIIALLLMVKIRSGSVVLVTLAVR